MPQRPGNGKTLATDPASSLQGPALLHKPARHNLGPAGTAKRRPPEQWLRGEAAAGAWPAREAAVGCRNFVRALCHLHIGRKGHVTLTFPLRSLGFFRRVRQPKSESAVFLGKILLGQRYLVPIANGGVRRRRNPTPAVLNAS